MSSADRCPGPVSRRSFLKVGTLGVGGLGLADFLRMKATASSSAAPPVVDKDTSVIFIWLPGGPPHMETYDMKPEAPMDYRGEFRPIATNVSGLDVCELMPLHARMADKYTIVRSVAHKFADHGGGHKRFLTGRDPKEPTGFINDYPMAGSCVAKLYENRKVGVPNYIFSGDRLGIDTFSFGSAYLGSAYHPFTFGGDPSSPKFSVQNLSLDSAMAGRLEDRVRLLGGFDQLRRRVDQNASMRAMDRFTEEAVSLLTSDKMRQAFDMSQESDELKQRYGKNPWGMRCMLARRLVEAGSKFVTMVVENCYWQNGPVLKEGVYNWDSHAVNCHMFRDLQVRLPLYDQCITALVEDLHQRGLTKKVLLVVTGEFGRTPRITNQIGSQTGVMQPGRDHWPQAMSMLLCGGGMRTGQVIGSTNTKGEYPQDRPLTPNDLWATVYRHLGIDWTHAFPDHAGRPMPILPYGEPIAELLPVA